MLFRSVERRLQTRITLVEYFRLRNIILEISRIFGNINANGKSLDTLMRVKRRKGGQMRKMVYGKQSPMYLQSDPRMVPSAITLWGNDIMNVNRELIELNFGLWGYSKLNSDLRMFLFNLVQGRLYLNNVRFRIDNSKPQCTFCVLKGKKELSDRGIVENRPEYAYYLELLPVENISHLFWECEFSQILIQQTYRWIRGLNWYAGNETISKSSFFSGVQHIQKKIVIADLLWKHFVKFFIFRCKLMQRLPKFPSLKHEFSGFLEPPEMRDIFNNILNINLIYDP